MAMETNAAPQSWARIVATGAVSGIIWGLLLTVLLWVLLPGHSLLVLIGCGVGFGVVYGVIAQLVQYGMTHLSGAGARAAANMRTPEIAGAGGRPRRASLDDEAWLTAAPVMSPPATPNEVTQLIPPMQPTPPRLHSLRARLKF